MSATDLAFGLAVIAGTFGAWLCVLLGALGALPYWTLGITVPLGAVLAVAWYAGTAR